MKKLKTILLVSLLAAMMTIGIVSLVDKDATKSITENRKLAERPKFTFSSLWDGSYGKAMETYYSDTFPGREMMLKANKVLNQFYYFSGSKEDNTLIVDFDGPGASGGQALNPVQPTDPSDTEEKPSQENPNQAEIPDSQPEDVPPAPQEPAPNYDDMDYTSAGSIIIMGDNAMDIPTATDSIIDSYGEAINNIQQALGEDVRVISLITPNSGQFYSPTDLHTGVHDQKAMIERCYGAMNDRVFTVDAYSVLDAHKQEDLFFRTDHHWTALGAYYAYTAFCKTAGFEPVPLENFKTGTYEGFVGSMYGYTSQYPQSQALKDNPDTLTYYLPPVETQAAFFPNAEMNNAQANWVDVINTNLPESEKNRYMCFLSGDHPIVRVTSSSNGPTCVVLKDSYGNAFIPFLTSHYSEILVIDPREFNQDGRPRLDLVSFVQEHQVQDVIALNYPFMINLKSYVKLLNKLVGIGLEG